MAKIDTLIMTKTDEIYIPIYTYIAQGIYICKGVPPSQQELIGVL